MYSGKDFENDLVQSAKNQNRLDHFIRLYDPTGKKRGVSNPCDFIYHVGGKTCLLELKTSQTGRFDFSLMTDNQYEEIKNRVRKVYGMVGGFLFYDRKNTLVYYFSINSIFMAKEVNFLKSIKSGEYCKYGFPVKFKIKRVHIEIDIEHLKETILKSKSYTKGG